VRGPTASQTDRIGEGFCHGGEIIVMGMVGPNPRRPLLAPNSGISTAGSQLQKKFEHAGDFGVGGTPNKVNLQVFENTLRQHVNSPATQVVNGNYRGKQAIIGSLGIFVALTNRLGGGCGADCRDGHT